MEDTNESTVTTMAGKDVAVYALAIGTVFTKNVYRVVNQFFQEAEDNNSTLEIRRKVAEKIFLCFWLVSVAPTTSGLNKDELERLFITAVRYFQHVGFFDERLVLLASRDTSIYLLESECEVLAFVAELITESASHTFGPRNLSCSHLLRKDVVPNQAYALNETRDSTPHRPTRGNADNHKRRKESTPEQKYEFSNFFGHKAE